MPPQQSQETQIALLEQEVSHLKKEVAEMNVSVKELVDAWKAATGFLKFIRVLGMCAAAISTLIALFHEKLFPHG